MLALLLLMMVDDLRKVDKPNDYLGSWGEKPEGSQRLKALSACCCLGTSSQTLSLI